MTDEMITYLIGLVPSMSLVVTMIPVMIRFWSYARKIFKRDQSTEAQIKVLNEKLSELAEVNSQIKKENLYLRRQNNKIMSKLTNVYIPEDKEN